MTEPAEQAQQGVSRPGSRRRSKSAPGRTALWHWPLIVAMRCAIWTLGALPGWIAYPIADLCAVPIAIMWSLQDRGGQRVRGYWRNVRIVYREGGLGPRRPRRHLWRVARHLTWLLVDSCRLHRLTTANVDRLVEQSEFPQLQALYREGKGVIWATAHVGVWDVAGYFCALKSIPITSVFRPSPIPGIDRIIERLRTRSGQVVVAKHNVIGTLRQVLARGETVGLLCDSAGRRGDSFPPFLGTPAATIATPALLQRTSGAPIVVVTVERTGRFRFALRVWDVIRPESGADRAEAVDRVLTRINDGLSRAVAEAPEQWFWQGRRFKHRPPGEVAGPDGLPPLAAAPERVS